MRPSDREPYGIYRDHVCVVIELRGFRFPFSCVKTNQPVFYHSAYDVRHSLMHVVLAWCVICFLVNLLLDVRLAYPLPLFLEVALRIGVYFFVGFFLLRSYHRTARRLWIGLGEELLARRSRRRRLGVKLTFGGLAFYVGYVVSEFVLANFGILFSADGPLTLVPYAFALPVVAGIPLLVMSYFPILRVSKKNARFVWLRGAGREFLDGLPVFPEA